MDKFLNLWYVVCFLVFSCDKESCRSKELKIFFPHLLFHEVLIDNHYNSKESFREHFESEMQIYQPIDEDTSHVGFNLLLFWHIINEIVLFGLQWEHMGDTGFNVFRDHLNVLEFIFFTFVFFDIKAERLCRFLSWFFDTFGFILLNAQASGLPVDLVVESFVFVIKVVFFINDVGEFFSEESVEGLHGQ